jgi:hypothetical protein
MANTAIRPRTQAAAEPLALLLWVGINSLSLFLSASRWNLWPGAPKPLESTAAWQLLVVDAISLAVFCPLLLSNGRRAVLIALSTAPFLEIAGFLAGVSMRHLAAAYAVLAIWLATLFVWQNAMPGRRGRMLVVAAAGVWTIGPALLGYLHEEFFLAGVATSGGRLIAWSVLSMLVSPLDGEAPNIFAITMLGSFLIAGAALAWVGYRRRRGHGEAVGTVVG